MKNLGKESARIGLGYRKDNLGPSEKGVLETEKLGLGNGTESALC